MFKYFLICCALYACMAVAQDGYATQNGGTTGGSGGTTTTVTAAPAFTSAIKGNARKTVYVNGTLTLSSSATVGSNTTIIGIGAASGFSKYGLKINDASNVIVRNLVISKVQGNDGINVQRAKNVWIDHNEFFSDLTHGFDYYDGSLDLTHAVDFVTVSNNYFHDHYKCSLIGSDPDNASEDTGTFHITYHHNYWKNIHTRTPAMRFGHVHSYNNLFENIVSQGIHSRSFAQVLIEGNVFVNATEPVTTYGFVIPDDSPIDPAGDLEPDGFANLGAANDFGGGKNNITATGSFTSVPYSYTLTPLAQVLSFVTANAGIGKI